MARDDDNELAFVKLVPAALMLVSLMFTVLAVGITHSRASSIDEVGGTRNQWTGGDRCRGMKLRADVDTVLLGFDLSLRATQGAELSFHVYSSDHVGELYYKVEGASATKGGSLGEEWGWETSPPLEVELAARKHYALLACWNAAAEIGFRGAPRVAPQPLRFGEYLGGAGYSRRGNLPATMRIATTTHDYMGRIRTTIDGRRMTSRPFVDYDPLEPLPTGDASSAAESGAQPAENPDAGFAKGCTIEASACGD